MCTPSVVRVRLPATAQLKAQGQALIKRDIVVIVVAAAIIAGNAILNSQMKLNRGQPSP